MCPVKPVRGESSEATLGALVKTFFGVCVCGVWELVADGAFIEFALASCENIFGAANKNIAVGRSIASSLFFVSKATAPLLRMDIGSGQRHR